MTIAVILFAMLTATLIIKLLAEIALLVLLAQGIVGVFSGAARERNPVYRLLRMLGRPWVGAARMVSPRFVMDRHVPLLAFLILLLVWLAATAAKVAICLQIGIALCS